MRVFISGGCKNGKSYYAQRVAKSAGAPLYYIATMIPHDHEDDARILRHRKERENWGFETIECGRDIQNVLNNADQNGSFLLDSVTALLSNEMFAPEFRPDAAEKVTFSLCTLEFEDHRPLYDWVLKELDIDREPPRQIEFARMNLNYTLTSKRKCLKLVQDGVVSGWDDPRMATLCGIRRRGYPAEAVRDFCDRIGVSKANSVIDYALLEACVRENLNAAAPRVMAVLRPLKVVIDNYPEGQVENIEIECNPERPEMGMRTVEFSRELYIEQEDFMEEPPKKYFRLFPGNEVRLKSAYFVKCVGFDKDADGNITCVHCTYDPESKGGNSPDGRKVKGTIHWVSAGHALDAEIRLYDRLFLTENPSEETAGGDFLENLNPDSLTVLTGCKLEKNMENCKPGDTFQFLRQGYYCVDKDSAPGHIVLNRTVAIKDSWAKAQKK